MIIAGGYRAAAAAGYTAQGVTFPDSSGFGMHRGADLTTNTDSKVGLFSVWVKFDAAGDGITQYFLGTGGGTFVVYKFSDNKLGAYAFTGSFILNMASSGTFVANGAWRHIAMAWDVGNTVAQMYVDGSDVRAGSPTITNNNIDYTTADWGIIADSGQANTVKGDVADLYFNNVATLDISNATNLQKFRSAGGAPVDIGSDGSTPTGTAPIICCKGSVASWHTNKGGGAGFSKFGTLSASATNPP